MIKRTKKEKVGLVVGIIITILSFFGYSVPIIPEIGRIIVENTSDESEEKVTVKEYILKEKDIDEESEEFIDESVDESLEQDK